MAKKKVVKSKFEWSKWGFKVLKHTLYVFLAGLGAIYGNNPNYLMIAPMLVALENYLKHK